ncbi:MAG: hypothetical protein AAGI01_05790 [Myxococcota bacterium]
MGFEMTALITAEVHQETRKKIMTWVQHAIPFAREAAGDDAFPERMVLGSVERTSYMLDYDAAEDVHEVASELDSVFWAAAVELSRTFGVDVALMHTDCFGGACVTEGQVWRAGVRDDAVDTTSVGAMQRAVGVEGATGYFDGFVRGYFGENVDVARHRHLVADVLETHEEEQG